MEIENDSVLIIVDVQKDFCPDGALPVPNGDKVVVALNKIIHKFNGRVVASQDWHPFDHCSFQNHGGAWPQHCIKGTRGVAIHSDLQLPSSTKYIQKGTDPDKEAYSAFEGTDLASHLKMWGVKTVFVAGLATDYCVKATALDAVKEGFKTILIPDACRGVDKKTTLEALKEMSRANVTMALTSALKRQ